MCANTSANLFKNPHQDVTMVQVVVGVDDTFPTPGEPGISTSGSARVISLPP